MDAPRIVNCVGVVSAAGSSRSPHGTRVTGGAPRSLGRCTSPFPAPTSTRSASRAWESLTPQLTEPPDADPHVRWCGREVGENVLSYSLSRSPDCCNTRYTPAWRLPSVRVGQLRSANVVLSSMADRQHEHSLCLDPMDNPIRRMRKLTDLRVAQLGHHPSGLGIRAQLFGTGEDAAYPSFGGEWSLNGDDARNLFDALQRDGRPDDAHDVRRRRRGYALRLRAAAVARNRAKTSAWALPCATPLPATICASAVRTSSANSTRSSNAS
ncbi:hypothetical protein BH09GEM1_BH09GEM1_39270 [soil metagenome]